MDIKSSALYLASLISIFLCFSAFGGMTNFWMVIWFVVLTSAIAQTLLHYYNQRVEFRASMKDCAELVIVPIFMLLMLKNASETPIAQFGQLIMLSYFITKLLLMTLFSAWPNKTKGFA
jgi:hypothetical protein